MLPVNPLLEMSLQLQISESVNEHYYIPHVISKLICKDVMSGKVEKNGMSQFKRKTSEAKTQL